MRRIGIGVGLVMLTLVVGWRWTLLADDSPREPQTSVPNPVVAAQPTAVQETEKPKKPLKERLKPESPLEKFMRKKLSASNLVLEGLVTEDFGMISKGAKQMEEMSQAEQWRVSNDAIYRQLSDDFRRIAQQLQKDAKKSTIDSAALTWIKATMSCIECHKYTKGMLVSGE